ncbi:hypothetical protein Q6375_05950 [Clostridium septicum]|uniref:hypothetical protein n=1 Tax=Clostridium septicum TaxID=1504 RepID=UPI00272E9F5C|nr:hypothetical protein [Clostridium septicum]WLF70531.1 hypothetical protein Q6375_05950 [Clostridium septicum]
MSNIKKTLKYIVTILGILFLGSLGLHGYNMGRLVYTDLDVLKIPYIDKYYVAIGEKDDATDVFKKYMADNNWQFIENISEILIFRKGNIQKEVHLDNLKEIKKNKHK